MYHSRFQHVMDTSWWDSSMHMATYKHILPRTLLFQLIINWFAMLRLSSWICIVCIRNWWPLNYNFTLNPWGYYLCSRFTSLKVPNSPVGQSCPQVVKVKCWRSTIFDEHSWQVGLDPLPRTGIVRKSNAMY